MNDYQTTSPLRVSGNEPLLLDDPDTVWLIQSGSMAVFAVRVVDGVPKGARRYLFSLTIDEVLFGIGGLGDTRFLAIAVAETALVQLSLTDLVEGGQLTHVLHWRDRLTNLFAQTDISLTLPAFERLEDANKLASNLKELHREFRSSLEQLEQQENENQFSQFQERQRLNQRSIRGAIGDLVSILKPKQGQLLPEGTPLLIAAGAVGRAMGIEIRPPAPSEDMKRIKNPLDAIARASRICTRRVLLNDGWWRTDCGPILAYREADNSPVALLPAGRGKYEIFDPLQHKRFPVTPETVRQLYPFAYTFYRPFPDKELNALELLKFSFRSLGLDVMIILIVGILATLLGMIFPQATGIIVDKVIPSSDRGLLFKSVSACWQLVSAKLPSS